MQGKIGEKNDIDFRVSPIRGAGVGSVWME